MIGEDMDKSKVARFLWPTVYINVQCTIYTVNHKKVEPFYFCNNFVKYKRNWIIFGTFLA